MRGSWLAARGDVEADRLLVVGHGLGGYLALRMALEGADAGAGASAEAARPANASQFIICGAVALCPLAPGVGGDLPVGPEGREVAGGAVQWSGGD